MKYFAHISLCFTLVTVFSLLACGSKNSATSQAEQTTTTPTEQKVSVTFNADSAFAFVQKQCDFGPRTPESAAHKKCGDYIVEQFKHYKLQVTEQHAQVNTWDGKTLPCRNIIASYKPEAEKRVLLCAHWDCRPWCDADADEANHKKPVMGANDGASGVAVMLEVARLLKDLQPQYGIDFICFDMEDYGAPYWGEESAPQDGSDWCLGSQYWAQNPHVAGYRAEYGILLDMVGGKDVRFCREYYSMQYASSIMTKVWSAAEAVGADKYFLYEDGSVAIDDHLPINQYLGVPTIDIIPCLAGPQGGFSATWHTVNDTPENISREVLGAVGQTLIQVLGSEAF